MAKKDEGFLLDSDGNPVQSSSGPVRSGSYNDEKVTQNRMKAAEDKLAADVQEKLKAKSDSDRVSKDAEESAKAPAAVSVKQPTRPGQGAAKPKAPVVTKEQLAKSGFDNLRDYMNAQKGLKRRDGKAPDAAKPATTTSKPTAKPSEPAAKPSEPAAKPSAPAVSNSYRLEGAGRPKPAAKSSEPAASAGKSMFQRIAEKETIADRIRQRGEDDLKSRGMKAGGSVRGAGIAQRGVRKCKMV
jgi:hypothetical protein